MLILSVGIQLGHKGSSFKTDLDLAEAIQEVGVEGKQEVEVFGLVVLLVRDPHLVSLKAFVGIAYHELLVVDSHVDQDLHYRVDDDDSNGYNCGYHGNLGYVGKLLVVLDLG